MSETGQENHEGGVGSVTDPAAIADRPTGRGWRRWPRLVAEIVGTAPIRLALVVAMTVVAYHYSLLTLMRSLGVDSPLAYLGLVPMIGFGIAVYHSRPRRSEPDVHDRYLDRIIGVPLVVVPVAVALVLPARLSTFYWLWRIDLLTLPLFVAGAVALLFGTRTLFRSRVGIAFLALSWPVPFRWLLASWLDPFTTATIKVITKVCGVVPLATAVVNGTQGEFSVQGPAGHIRIVVASVCSGASSLLGWLLVGGAAVLVSSGRRSRKLGWLAVGMALVWALNIVRILTIFLAAKLWGQAVAFDVLHPYIGLVFFAAATMTMVLTVAPRMGVDFVSGAATGDRLHLSPRVAGAVPRYRLAACVLLAVAVLLGVLDEGLKAVDPVASALGAPRLMGFANSVLHMPGFDGRRKTQYDWTTQYFGENSDWTRYEFEAGGTTALSSQVPITADVITTDDWQAFNDFGVEACYRFHGYEVQNLREVDLGSGFVGTVLTWRDPRSPITWTSIYWYWPIKVGNITRYQRIVLLVDADRNAVFSAPDLSSKAGSQLGISLNATITGAVGGASDAHDAQVRRFLVAFARQMITTAASREVRTDGP